MTNGARYRRGPCGRGPETRVERRRHVARPQCSQPRRYGSPPAARARSRTVRPRRLVVVGAGRGEVLLSQAHLLAAPAALGGSGAMHEGVQAE